MLMTLKKDSEGSPIIVVFDAKGKTFRSDIYKEYKANRHTVTANLVGISLSVKEGSGCYIPIGLYLSK